MSKYFSILLVLGLSLGLLFHPGCKKWEGNYYVSEVQNTTVYYTDTNQSSFAVLVQVANEEEKGVGAVINAWKFEYYAGGELVLEVNSDNYQYLEYIVTIYQQAPVGDSYVLPGYINIVSGRIADQWRVFGDIFNGAQPDRMKYHLILWDENNYRHDLTGEAVNTHNIL